MVQYIVLSLAGKYRSDILTQDMNLLFHTRVSEKLRNLLCHDLVMFM